jgi:hypothetical protein
MVLDASPYPDGFPAERHVGYVPESSLVAIEWFLPTFAVIPEHKAFRHVKQRKAVLPLGKDPVTGRAKTRTRYASIKGKTFAACVDAEQKLQELKDELTEQVRPRKPPAIRRTTRFGGPSRTGTSGYPRPRRPGRGPPTTSLHVPEVAQAEARGRSAARGHHREPVGHGGRDRPAGWRGRALGHPGRDSPGDHLRHAPQERDRLQRTEPCQRRRAARGRAQAEGLGLPDRRAGRARHRVMQRRPDVRAHDARHPDGPASWRDPGTPVGGHQLRAPGGLRRPLPQGRRVQHGPAWRPAV